MERATEGTEARIYPWGSAPPSALHARFAAGWSQTAPAGSLDASATIDGVRDLAGNVHEWTSSLSAPYPYAAGDEREDGKVPGERVTRGDAHNSAPEELRSAWRGADVSRAPGEGHHNIAFRCAKSLR